jgi:membrane protein implicated in regulation of membrane protease activity
MHPQSLQEAPAAMSNNVIFWLSLGLVLMAAETIVPGAFLLWFGVAGLVMAALVWLLPDLHGLAQAVLFGGLAVAAVQVYRFYFRRHEPTSEQPLLNRRSEQYVGRVFVLDGAIENGFGKIRIGDSIWTVAGDPLPAGARVVVTAVDGMTLKVRAAD